MTNLPTLQDFSKGSISKAVVKEALTHPITLYPSVMAVLCGVAGVLFTSPAWLLVAGGCLLASTGGAVVNYCFRFDSFGKQYLNNLSQSMLQQKDNLINSLKSELLSCESIDSDRSGQGLSQFSTAKEKYADVKEELGKKLNSGELMYGRFMGSVEQVYLGILDNLREVVGILHGLPDAEGNEQNLRKAFDKTNDENERRQIGAILKRSDLRRNQLKKADALLARNEEAITELESTMITVSEMKTEERLSEVDHEESIKQLKEIAQRVSSLYEDKDNL
jgi:hypothetical protein